MAVNYKPGGICAVNPYLIVADGERLLDFLRQVFAARQLDLTRDAAGHIRNATLAIGDGTLMFSQARADFPPQPASLYIYVPDVDAAYHAALAHGARSLQAPADHFYGDRGAGVADLEGNSWWIGTHIEDVSPEEIARRLRTPS